VAGSRCISSSTRSLISAYCKLQPLLELAKWGPFEPHSLTSSKPITPIPAAYVKNICNRLFESEAPYGLRHGLKIDLVATGRHLVVLRRVSKRRLRKLKKRNIYTYDNWWWLDMGRASRAKEKNLPHREGETRLKWARRKSTQYLESLVGFYLSEHSAAKLRGDTKVPLPNAKIAAAALVLKERAGRETDPNKVR
jgi:hypothetical protein